MKNKLTIMPGDDMHMNCLMAPFSLNMVVGEDRQHLLAYGKAAFAAGKKAKDAEIAALKQDAARLAPVIAAAQEWSSERAPSDHAEGELMKAIATMDGDWPGCEDCDHECDEPCMPATVVQMHGSIDACLAKLDAKKAADARKHWGAIAQAVQP